MPRRDLDSRARLIAATRRLLWERGYTGTSPRDIQDGAGVGQGSMYHHFAGKPELAAVALQESGDALVAAAAESLDSAGSVFDRLVSYLRRERPVLRGCPIGRMTEDAEVMASPALRAPVEQTLFRLRSRITGLLEEGQRSGEFVSTIPPGRLAASITATVQGAYVLSKAANDEHPFADAIEGTIDLLRSQLSSAAARN
ncbi:MAG: TetR family transcriptional regulator [Rhodoglobus sp.]